MQFLYFFVVFFYNPNLQCAKDINWLNHDTQTDTEHDMNADTNVLADVNIKHKQHPSVQKKSSANKAIHIQTIPKQAFSALPVFWFLTYIIQQLGNLPHQMRYAFYPDE